MEYDRFIQEVRNLDFIENNETADAAVKATLGILVSRLTEEQARNFTRNLPDPLNLETLRSHQKRAIGISPDEYTGVIRTQFNLGEDQARALIDTVLRSTKATLGEEAFYELRHHMPPEWADVVERA